jgi:hypothetical protein
VLDEYRFAATGLGIVYSLMYVLLVVGLVGAVLVWEAQVIAGLFGAPIWVGFIILSLPLVWLVVYMELFYEE